MIESESARMSSAAEARFRVDLPNSRPRAVKVIALDGRSEPVVDDLARRRWNGAAFFTATDLASDPVRLHEEVDSADLVVMVATAGESPRDVALIGEACSRERVTTTGLIMCDEETSDVALSKTLSRLRPWMLMLVVASSRDYIEDMLLALRA
ncbi:MAG: hypothetical protein O2930_07950 [Acidobacteria bacterium]|nr:hypothetical protein [Acidobacteriota bacterium]